MGGGLFVYSSSSQGSTNFTLTVSQSRVTYNTAVYKGGGLFALADSYDTWSERKNLLLNSLVVHYNKACLGAGLSYEGIVPIKSNISFYNNSKEWVGYNEFSYPSKLRLMLKTLTEEEAQMVSSSQ